MTADIHQLSSAVNRVKQQQADDEAFLRSREGRDAVAHLGHVALCLIGPPRPVTFQGGNALHWPVKFLTNPVPERATQRDLSAHWEGSKADPHIVLLRHVWTKGDAYADRLKRACYVRMIEDDPAMRQLNAAWVDMMDWEANWSSLLAIGREDLLAAGETVDYWDDKQRMAMLRAHVAARLKKAKRK